MTNTNPGNDQIVACVRSRRKEAGKEGDRMIRRVTALKEQDSLRMRYSRPCGDRVMRGCSLMGVPSRSGGRS